LHGDLRPAHGEDPSEAADLYGCWLPSYSPRSGKPEVPESEIRGELEADHVFGTQALSGDP